MNWMKRILLLGAVLSCVFAPAFAQTTETPPPDGTTTPTEIPATLPPPERPTARTTLTIGAVEVQLYFDVIKQGGIGVLHVIGDGVTAARAEWLGDIIPFFPARDDGLFAILSANIEQTSREYDLTVYVDTAAGTSSASTRVRVGLGGFVRSTFTVPNDRAYLIDPEIERAEFARLSAVFEDNTAPRQWDETGFAMPIFGEFTSPFGELRLLNDVVETRHTGWDMRAATGVPVQASAAGTVAFAGLLDIRGNYVIVDHGQGVFSGYAHLSQIHVTRGQKVTAGQVLGMSGNTGRSSGPHMHWEMNINGDWVDPRIVSRTWLP